MSELNLEPIKARLREISRAPWAYFGIEDISGGMIYDREVVVAHIHWDNEPTEPIRPTVPEWQADRNGYFIANAPTDIQALLEEVERLRALIKGENK